LRLIRIIPNRNMFHKLILSLLIVVTNNIYSSGSIGVVYNNSKPAVTGKIITKNNEPVVGAAIIVEGTFISTTTDMEGKFEFFDIPLGVYTITISSLGYVTTSRSVEIKDNLPVDLIIVLDENALQIPEILIMGRTDRLFSKIPGSANYINSTTINNINPISGNEVFRQSTGLNVVDEEGAGMRVNIGIRGLDPDRSRSVLILEDGIPIALAPYGEPEMYYTPSFERMMGVEILKGSGQIMYGPQTIGGVINYITNQPPPVSSGRIKLQAGQGGYLNGLFNYGNTQGNVGYTISLLKKRADKLGQTAFDINDLSGKVVLNLSEKAIISLKAGIYEETSNSTYLGMTQTMFDQGGQDFVHMAPHDLLKLSRYTLTVNHDYKWTKKTKIRSTAFAYSTSRNWRRQEFVSNNSKNDKPNNWTGVTWGDESITGGAIYMRDATVHRNRRFEVAGFESGITHEYNLFGIENTLKFGGRYIFEKANEQRINGTRFNSKSGALVEDETRPGNAISTYIHQMSKLRSNIELNLGIRMEHFRYARDINRRTFVVNGQNLLLDTILNKSNTITQLIPGVGVTWKTSDKVNIFAGLHSGFAPPRTKDAISNIGEVYNLNAEKSINTELGIRANPFRGLQTEMTFFHMNFSNQIIPVSESSGGLGVGLVNGGTTIHQGIESAIHLQIAEIVGWTKTNLSLHTNITYVEAYFTGERQKDGKNIQGNSTPYAPSWIINSNITFQSFKGFLFSLSHNYISDQFADELNTTKATPDGRIGLIPTYHTLDGNMSYHLQKLNMTFSLCVKNITNERYIASRRPQGIRLGLPRWVTLGIDYNF